MASRFGHLDHPAWETAAGTFAGYALLMLAVFLSLFAFPYALWVLV